MCSGFVKLQEPEYIGIRERLAEEVRILEDLAAEMANIEHLRNRSIREMQFVRMKEEQLEMEKTEDAAALLAMAAVHPITVCRALMQFGYEPFPTTIGKQYVFFGQNQVFLPNIFRYMRQLASSTHFSTLFEGLDSAICIHIVGGIVDSYMWEYFGKFTSNSRSDVRKKQSLGNALKFTLRLTLTDIAVKIATRPLKVVMLRQIACIVGSDPSFSTMKGLELGLKAGWTDLFSGLSTELRNVLLGSFLAFLGRYAINRLFFIHYNKNREAVRRDVELAEIYDSVITLMNKFTELGLATLFQSTVGCPLEATSRIRSIAGTSLTAAKNLPVECKTHTGAWDFLTLKNALLNGSKWFFRVKPPGPGILPEFSF